MEFDYEHITKLSNKLKSVLFKNIPDIYLNGDPIKSFPGILNISFAYVEGENLIVAVKELAVSSG